MTGLTLTGNFSFVTWHFALPTSPKRLRHRYHTIAGLTNGAGSGVAAEFESVA
jgi:hypothetical protein